MSSVLPHLTLDCPGADEKFIAYGGHRLWRAPQVPARTQIPDSQPLIVESIPDGVRVIQKTETRTGIQKAMQVTLPDDSPTVVVDHVLTNHGLWPVETAPWGITELREDGVAICPQTDQFDDADGVRLNRSFPNPVGWLAYHMTGLAAISAAAPINPNANAMSA